MSKYRFHINIANMLKEKSRRKNPLMIAKHLSGFYDVTAPLRGTLPGVCFTAFPLISGTVLWPRNTTLPQ